MSTMETAHRHDHGEAGHTHPHEGTHPGDDPGPLLAAASSASVALDIGGGKGALVILPGERFRGREIEISPVDRVDARVHTGVHERSSRAGLKLTAIFGSLTAGEYVIWEDGATAGPTVSVPDGAVAQVRLS